MPSQATWLTGNAGVDQFPLPYAPGWIDRLVQWIDRLPVPPWLIYPILFVLAWLLIVVSRWIEGSAPFSTLDTPYAFVAFYSFAGLAAIHYLDRAAGRAFDHFKPALSKSAVETAGLRYELTILPARETRVVALIGLGFWALELVIGNEARTVLGSGMYFWTLATVTGVGFVFTSELLYHTARQLQLVSRIHAAAEHLDLFDFGPLYSFSGLTARTGLVFALILWFDFALNPETMNNLPLILLNGIILLLCAACFVLPLHGMHQRIVAEKARLEHEANERVTAMVQHLYARVDSLDLHDADAVNKTVSSLVATRELIAKMPTWPWRHETFTFFFSALTLPVVVFLIQMFLKSLIGFK